MMKRKVSRPQRQGKKKKTDAHVKIMSGIFAESVKNLAMEVFSENSSIKIRER